MSSSQWGHEDELEAARDAGYELGYDDGHEEGAAEAQTAGDEYTVEGLWLEQQKRNGINVLDPFVCRWDAAERRLVVEQQ